MPQVLKEELRGRILSASLEVFAASGFSGATMSTIAARAEIGTATIYRYYASKEELFAAVITPQLAQRFEQLLEQRVDALGRVALGRAKQADDLGDEMFEFWLENRLAIVVLLDRCEGTEYGRFRQQFVDRLVAATLAQLRSERPTLRPTATQRFVLERIFENTRRTLAAILEQHEKRDALREAIDAFWSYQIPGLRGFTKHLLA